MKLLLAEQPLATILTAPLAGRLVEKVHPGLLGGIGMAIFATVLVTLYLSLIHIYVFGEKSDTIFSSVVINGRGKVSVHLRTAGYLAQYVFLSAAVGHAVQFLQGYHFGVDTVSYTHLWGDSVGSSIVRFAVY